MSAITETAAAAGGGALTKTLAGGSVMGKDDFLRLLVTQLQNQDPLNPQDPTEFTAQLAQFSSLEQLFSVNENLGKVVSSSQEMERMSALSLIGKEVVSDSGAFHFNGKPLALGYELGASAHEVSLHVLDGNGRNLATLPAPETSRGEHYLSWDGTGLDGQPVAAGDYQVVVRAVNAQEEAVPATGLVKSTISGVDMIGGVNWLVSEAGDFQLKDIVSVRDI